MGLKSLVRRVKRGFALRALLHVTKGLSNGQFGRGPQKAWSALEGMKTWIGLAFMVLGYTAGAAFNLDLCPDCPEWNQALMVVGAVLAEVGLLDGANREPSAEDEREPPLPYEEVTPRSRNR
jgi:hypothetical protein